MSASQSDSLAQDLNWEAYCASVPGWGEALGVPPFRLEVPAERRRRFRSRLGWMGDRGGTHLISGVTNAPVLQTQPRPGPADAVLIGCLRRGRLLVHSPEHVLEIGPGALFASDYECPLALRWSAHAVAFLVLPRALMGRGSAFVGAGSLTLIPPGGLAPLLRDLLLATARTAPSLDPDARAAALRAATELALGLLQTAKTAPEAADLGPDVALLAARRFMVRHLADPDLSVAAIAAAAGCSRSALYRLFAHGGLSVGGALREMRLQRARSLLADAPDAADIAAVGDACGYADASAFGRAFRRRFAMAPRDWRATMAAPGGGEDG